MDEFVTDPDAKLAQTKVWREGLSELLSQMQEQQAGERNLGSQLPSLEHCITDVQNAIVRLAARTLELTPADEKPPGVKPESDPVD